MSEKIVTANERYARDIGFDFGNTNSDVQAELLNGFAAGLTSYPENGIDMQIAYMVDRMDEKTKKLIRKIAEFTEEV